MSYRVYLGIFLSLILMISFQNCQEGFTPFENGQNFSSEGPTQKSNFDFAQMNTCVNNVGLEKLAACATKNSIVPVELTQELVDSCRSKFSASGLILNMWVAKCLTANKVPVAGYREVKQLDIDTCYLNVGPNKIAACLTKNAILPKDLTQETINSCIDAVGVESVEKCLRNRGYLRNRKIVTQFDVAVCNIASGMDKLGYCLFNSEIPVGVATQANLETCESNVGIDNISKCLRINKFIPDTLQQVLISACAEDVGESNIASCLEKNGYNLADLITDGQEPQALIDSCIAVVGVQNISKCLRKKEVANLVPTTDDLFQCRDLVGEENIVTCLEKNGLKTATLEQVNLDTCIDNKGIEGAIGCLKANGYLPLKLSELLATDGVFEANCVHCHNSTDLKGNFDITNWQSLSQKVMAGDLENSRIYQRMTDINNPMPQDNGLLATKFVRQVEAWIMHGARND